MAPHQELQHQLSGGRRDEEEESRQPRGFISEEIISPVSLLRSDRFLKNGMKAPVTTLGDISEMTDIRCTASYTNARPRVRCQRDQVALQNDTNHLLQCRMGTAPERIRPKATNNNTMQRNRSDSDNCYYEFRHMEFVETGQLPTTKAVVPMNETPIDNSRTTGEDLQEDCNQCPNTSRRAISTTTSTSDIQVLGPNRPSLLEMDPERALLSQSPIRPSSAPSSSEQFHPSPLKARPMTATIRRPKMESESSNFDNQLHEHIRAFQAQQKLSPPERRISNSPLMNRQRTASEDWAKGHQLPDPSMVVMQSQPSADLAILTLKSVDR